MEQELETPLDGRTASGPDDELMIVRTYQAEITEGPDRTVDLRIVPYGETAEAADGFGGVARGIPYTEQWMPGVFSHQLNAANRVYMNVEHEQGIKGVVGHGSALVERSDGFYGSFKFHDTDHGETARILALDGALPGVSLEARPRPGGTMRTLTGVVQRTKADLRAIALCREPAYKGARVLAVREQADIVDENILPFDLDPELIERCKRLGIELPQRYEAHPAHTDTPESTGTSEAAPATDTQTTSLSEVQQ